jgi:hypothetical protein
MVLSENDFYEVIQSINLTLSSLGEKIDQLAINLSSSDDKIGDESVLCASASGDLIERFKLSLIKYGVACDLIPGQFNREQALNKATYYFDHMKQITNHRAYLSRLCSQIDLYASPGICETDAKGKIQQESPEDLKGFLEKYETLTEEQIEKIRFNDESVAWLVNGIKGRNYATVTKIMIVKSGIKQGVIE